MAIQCKISRTEESTIILRGSVYDLVNDTVNLLSEIHRTLQEDDSKMAAFYKGAISMLVNDPTEKMWNRHGMSDEGRTKISITLPENGGN